MKICKMEKPFGMEEFQLYNLKEDPSEEKDLALKNPEIYRQMLQYWEQYVEENVVILLDPK